MRRMQELLDDPAPFNIIKISDNDFVAEFEVGDLSYTYAVGQGSGKKWEIVFQVTGGSSTLKTPDGSSGFGVLGSGNAATVLSTVAALTREFIVEFTPNFFYFGAEESSRRKVYDILARKLTSLFPYELSTKIVGGEMIYEFRWTY